jgi:hypothetical protein
MFPTSSFSPSCRSWVASLSLAIGATACAVGSGTDEAASSNAAPIIGGSQDSGDAAVVALALVQGNSLTGCSGTLIAPTVVLTAAHCVFPATSGSPGAVSTGTFYAFFGPSVTWPPPAGTPRVFSVDWDPRYTITNPPSVQPHDVGVAILSAPVAVAPAPVSVVQTSLTAGQRMRIAGFGETVAGNVASWGSKYTADTTFGAFAAFPNYESMIQTGGTPTTCSGDSGGPIFATMNGAESIVGVTSGGDCQSEALFAETGLIPQPEPNFAWLNKYTTTSVLVANPYGHFEAESTLSVQYTGVPPSPTAQNWLALVPQGSPTTSYVAWTYIANGTTGSALLEVPADPAPGTYTVRVVADNGYTVLAESNAFTIDELPVSTDAATYAYRAPINVTYQTPSPEYQDWVDIAPAGSAPTSYVAWAYTGGFNEGTVTLQSGSLFPGTYVARFLLRNGFVVGGESAPFVVQSVPLSTDASTYARGVPVRVSFTDVAPTTTDWIEIATPQSATTAYLAWQFTGDATSGTLAFSSASLAPGTYVARFLPHDGATSVGQTAAFTVTP